MADFTTALTHAQSYAAHGYAQNTRQAYASDWRQFTTWCTDHQRCSLPATAETILGYIGALGDKLSGCGGAAWAAP
jgi:hypothetical protein